jgi:hypothetical protein
MGNRTEIDTRTREQVQMDTILTINELQDFVGVMFPWKIAQNDNEVILSKETIEEIILFIKKLTQGEDNE